MPMTDTEAASLCKMLATTIRATTAEWSHVDGIPQAIQQAYRDGWNDCADVIDEFAREIPAMVADSEGTMRRVMGDRPDFS